jgi:plastocyanin
MKTRLKVLGMMSGLLLLGFALLHSATTVSAAAEGKITGSVKLDGTVPHQRGIDMAKDPVCVKAHEGSPAHFETVVVGANGGLENVALYLSEGLSAAAQAEVPSTPVTFDQKNCMYTPHVLAMDVGQHMKVVNSDQTTHNIHPTPDPGTGNIGWNKSQPPGSPAFDVTWKHEEVAVAVKCNIHPWMHGYMVVVKGPFGTTDDTGSYTISGVPPGTYTVTAWQETYGTQDQKVTVAAGKAATADFTFKAK